MTDPMLEVVTRRLARLEQESRWWRRATLALLLVIVAVGALGQVPVPTRRLELETLVLRDPKGGPRAALGVGADGSPILAFYDPNGRTTRLMLGMSPTGPALTLSDQAGKARVGLTASDDGAVRLGFRGADTSSPHVQLEILPTGAAGLSLHDKNGALRLALGLVDGERPVIQLMDQAGNAVWRTP